MMIVPATKPRLSTRELERSLSRYKIDRELYPLLVVGIRGYYLNSMGVPGKNDRGIYDDAIFIHSPNLTASFNGNTDPTKFRKGKGRGRGKGMGVLDSGFWPVYRIDYHRPQHSKPYLALCQRLGDVTLTRDGDPPYKDTGRFGVNIHCGGRIGTGSEACQTIIKPQWPGFFNLLCVEAKRLFGSRWRQAVIPYTLLIEQERRR